MLNGQVVAITGGAGLIGSAFSRAIIQQGGKVIIGDVSRKNGVAMQDEFGSDKAVFVYVNTSSPNSIDEFVRKGVDYFGNIDAAVHCAYPRSSQWGARFEDLKPEGLAEDLFNQLGGAIMFSQRIVSHFRQQGHGNLVHIASIQGVAAPKFEHYEGTQMVSPIEYSAIKSGLISITRYLAKYCTGENIRVNCMSPGGILDNQPESFLEKYKADCTSKGMMNPDDLNGTLLYLLSDMSQIVNGQNIIVDDGWIL